MTHQFVGHRGNDICSGRHVSAFASHVGTMSDRQDATAIRLPAMDLKFTHQWSAAGREWELTGSVELAATGMLGGMPIPPEHQ